MALPDRYNRRMRQTWAMHAVWLPGTAISPGDIVQKGKDRLYTRVGSLKSFEPFRGRNAIELRTIESEALKTGFKSAATRVTFFQAGEPVSAARLDLDAEATVELSFKKSDSFSVATPIGTVETLQNLLEIAEAVRHVDSWLHSRWFIVREVLSARGFSVIGSTRRNRKISFSGKGKAVLDFANFGLNAGLEKTSSTKMDVEFVGAAGPLAMDLARVKKNGFVVVG